MKNEVRIKALNDAGNDTNYFSLELPNGFDKVDSLTIEFGSGEGTTRNNEYFAKNSKFYGQLMADGNIFNPYIHRRFLPSRFLQMTYSSRGYNNCLDDYGYNYAIRTIVKEVKKLALLERIDKTAFDERSKFFTINAVKKIIQRYSDDYAKYASQKKEKDYYQKESDLLISANKCVQNARTYGELANALNVYLPKISYKVGKSAEFNKTYKAAGAFYTIKHLIMFENCKFNGLGQKESLAVLNQYTDETEQYKLSAILDRLIKESNYKVG